LNSTPLTEEYTGLFASTEILVKPLSLKERDETFVTE
jgi:hypothetical protein